MKPERGGVEPRTGGGLPDNADEGGGEDDSPDAVSEWKTLFVKGVRLGGMAVALEDVPVWRNSGGSFHPLSAFPDFKEK